MTSDLAYPTQKKFSFLQTVVTEELGHRDERKDSQDNNGTGLNVTSLKMSTSGLPDQSGKMKEETIRGDSEKDKSDKIWEDFMSNEEIEKRNEKKEIKREDSDNIKLPNFGQVEKQSETFTLMSKTTEKEHANGRRNEMAKKKKKKRVLKQTALATHPRALPGTSGALPNTSPLENRKHDRVDTTNEMNGRHGPKLGRRQRLSPVRRRDPVTSEQILYQKVQELQFLMVTPLIEPVQYLHQTRQELLRLQGCSQRQAAQLLNSPSHQLLGTPVRGRPVGEMNTNDSDDGYSVLRSAQLHRTKPQRPWTSGHVRPQSHSGRHRQGRPYSAEHQVGNLCKDIGRNAPPGPGDSETASEEKGRGRRSRTNRGNYRGHSKCGTEVISGTEVTSSTEVTSGTEVTSETSQHQVRDHVDKHQSHNTRDGTSKSRSTSPVKEIQHTDTHLKHSHNPALKKWLKQKNKELLRQKAEERKRLREERAKKQEEVRARQETFKDSEKKVKEWMIQKRKEAWRKAKEERKEIEKNKFRAERDGHREVQGILRTRSLEHLSTNTGAGRGHFIPVIRPATVQGETSPIREVTSHCDEQAESKFVYKRPVSGHVRLIKLQQQQKCDAKKSEEERKANEYKLAEEKSKKMRMSYDQWLLKKREEDYAKRQEMARQKALAKSDPELERILQELARRRIENIRRGKKRVDTGMRNLDSNTFAGDQSLSGTQENLLPDNPSDSMSVSGQKQELRPRSATAKFPSNPLESRSPRRPMSAHVPTGSALERSTGDASSPKSFRLPFPPQEGAPRYVLAAQKKLFSPHIISSRSQSPQACQEDTQIVSDSVQEHNETVLHAVLQTEKSPICEIQPQPDFESSRNEGTPHPLKGEDSFFVTHGNLGEFKDTEAQFDQSELAPKAARVPEVGHWMKQSGEFDVLNPKNVDHSPKHKDHQESNVTGCVDDEQINNADDEKHENDVTTRAVHEQNTEDKFTIQHQAEIQELKENTIVLDTPTHKGSRLEGDSGAGKLSSDSFAGKLSGDSVAGKLSGDSVAGKLSSDSVAVKLSSDSVAVKQSGDSGTGKNVSFQGEDVVHEISDVSEASDIDKDETNEETDRDGDTPDIDVDESIEVQSSIVGNNDESGSNEGPNVNFQNGDDDDDKNSVSSESDTKQTLQEDADVSFSSSNDDLFPADDVIQELLSVPDAIACTRDTTDSEI